MLEELDRARLSGDHREAAAVAAKLQQVIDTSARYHPRDQAKCLLAMAKYRQEQAEFQEAIEFVRRALEIRQHQDGDNHEDVGDALNNLGFLYKETGQYLLSEEYYKRALDMWLRTPGRDSQLYAQGLNNLAKLYHLMGRHAEAEPLYRTALEIREAKAGLKSIEVAQTLNNLASLLCQQRRFERAEPLYQRALEIYQAIVPPRPTNVATVLDNLGSLCLAQRQPVKSAEFYDRALTLRLEALGESNPDTADTLFHLGMLRINVGEHEAAMALLTRVLRIRSEVLGPIHPDTTAVLVQEARLLHQQNRLDEAVSVIDRAIEAQERSRASPADRFESHLLRGKLLWAKNQRFEALADIDLAMESAERQRWQAYGSERELAAEFAGFRSAFELAVTWQNAVGNTQAAFTAMERSRSRALLDQIEASGMHLDREWSQLTPAEVRLEESRLRVKIAELATRLRHTAEPNASGQFAEQLATAQAQLYECLVQQRSQNRLYRALIAGGAMHLRIGQLQRDLREKQALLLMYMVGENESYVMQIAPDSASMHKLQVGDEEARTLGVAPGTLDRRRLEACLGDGQRGVLASLYNRQFGAEDYRRLHAFYGVLVPESIRGEAQSGRYRSLLIVPDGSLGFVPFEALVVECHDRDGRFLLDAVPAVAYEPSIAVFQTLNQRHRDRDPRRLAGVLSVGDPAHDAKTPNERLAANDSSGVHRATITPFGPVPRLPYSSRESKWVEQSFREYGEEVLTLTGKEATEGQVRQELKNKRIVHFACHGFVDEQYGNLFGHLLLATQAGDRLRPENDGMLTLDEICGLDLSGCEAAVLSACQTNLSPSQAGEGTWALSHGFLIAGASRVIASNWLVHDEAAASLVSLYCQHIARSLKDRDARHASALREAKLAIRKTDKWAAPYFWAPFVLLGAE